jgi:c-di-GMP-binding flagellar brake protein YcgR
MTNSEKRRFTRTPFEMEIRVITDDRIVVSNRLKDISLGGAYIAVENPLQEEAPCILSIDLIGPRSLLRIEIEGEVVRSEDDGMAVRFTRIDVDSLVHLRHLIKVHSQDPETIDYEFSSNLLEMKDSPTDSR